MRMPHSRFLAAFLGVVLAAVAVGSTPAQGPGDQKAPDQGQKPASPPADPAKEEKKKVDEFAEAARVLGGPAAHPECLWLGKRVVSLLWRDDIDTALRQLEFYDRFGCPGEHIQQTFRCVVRLGEIDQKNWEGRNVRLNGCWLNPSVPPVLATPAPAAAAAPGTSSQ